MRRYKIAFFFHRTYPPPYCSAARLVISSIKSSIKPCPVPMRRRTCHHPQPPRAPVSDSGEPKLLPVQLTAQQVQSIGVKTGVVEVQDAARRVAG